MCIRDRVRALLLANPAGAFTAAAGDLTAVGGRNAVRWRSAVLAYEAVLNEKLFDNRPLVIALVPYVSSRAPGEERRLVVEFRHGPQTLSSDMPRFQPPDQGFGHRFRDAAAALLVLVAYATVSAVLCVLAFRTRQFDWSRVEQ